jgi:hypothetical protein
LSIKNFAALLDEVLGVSMVPSDIPEMFSMVVFLTGRSIEWSRIMVEDIDEGFPILASGCGITCGVGFGIFRDLSGLFDGGNAMDDVIYTGRLGGFLE